MCKFDAKAVIVREIHWTLEKHGNGIKNYIRARKASSHEMFTYSKHAHTIQWEREFNAYK